MVDDDIDPPFEALLKDVLLLRVIVAATACDQQRAQRLWCSARFLGSRVKFPGKKTGQYKGNDKCSHDSVFEETERYHRRLRKSIFEGHLFKHFQKCLLDLLRGHDLKGAGAHPCFIATQRMLSRRGQVAIVTIGKLNGKRALR